MYITKMAYWRKITISLKKFAVFKAGLLVYRYALFCLYKVRVKEMHANIRRVYHIESESKRYILQKARLPTAA